MREKSPDDGGVFDEEDAGRQVIDAIEHAWRLLSMVNEWVRFADAKAGAIYAASGVIATLLYGLVKDLSKRPALLDITVVLTCVSLFLAVFLASWTLVPRTKGIDANAHQANLVFFDSIAHAYKRDRVGYIKELKRLSIDGGALLEQLGHQIHANSIIASTKNKHVAWGMRASVASGILLGMTTLQVSLL